MAERFIVDDAGTLIDILTRDTYDYVSDVCPVCNKLWSQTERFAKHNSELEKENEQLKHSINRMREEHCSEVKKLIEEYNSLDDELSKENEQLKKQNENLLAKLKFTAEQVNYSENLRKMLDGDVE